MDDLLSEFLTETNEAIDSLDVEIVRLEQEPNDPELIGSIFRLVHTIKGTCGFLGLPRLESVAHAGENVLGKFRDGELSVTPEAVTLILESIDTIKDLLNSLAETEQEPDGDDSNLIERLNAMANGQAAPPAAEADEPEDPVSDDVVEPVEEVEALSDEVSDFPDDEGAVEPQPLASFGAVAAEALVDRLGGISSIDAAVEVFCGKLMKDGGLSSPYDGADPIILQGKLVEYTVALAGGPNNYSEDENPVYQPPPMQSYSDEQFEAVATLFSESLVELEVPADAITDTLAAFRSERDRIAAAKAQAEKAAKLAAASEQGAQGETKKSDAPATQSIRVNVDLLENLMTMVSELVLSRNQLLQMVRKYEDSEFSTPLQRLSLITSDLQEGVMKTRMQQIGSAWSKLPRIVRDLSLDLDKKIELEMLGADTELDR